MEHSADTDWLLRENLELHRQLRIATAFLEKCYHSDRGAKGIRAPTEQEWQGIFDMLQENLAPLRFCRNFVDNDSRFIVTHILERNVKVVI
jgi:hypothetical protein